MQTRSDVSDAAAALASAWHTQRLGDVMSSIMQYPTRILLFKIWKEGFKVTVYERDFNVHCHFRLHPRTPIEKSKDSGDVADESRVGQHIRKEE